MLFVLNVGIQKLISGHLRQEQEMRQKLDFLDAQNASIRGENINKTNLNIIFTYLYSSREYK